MVYYKHWTTVVEAEDWPTEVDGNFVAYCNGCDWAEAADTRYYAIQRCKVHVRVTDKAHPKQTGHKNPTGSTPGPVTPVYSAKVAKLLNLAVDASSENEANLALAKARALHRKECAA
jgi:hypothetical protein